jgi:hypothetical protein
LKEVSVPEIGSIENGVLIGHHDELFLAAGAHSILDFALGKADVAAASYSAFKQNISQREAWARNRGAGYLHVIFPDKQSVCREAFPFDDPVCLGEKYLRQSSELADFIFYPLELLRHRKVSPYFRVDTHLTDEGMIAVAIQLVNKLLGTDVANYEGYLLERISGRHRSSGDLGSKLTPMHFENRVNIEMDWKARNFSNGVSTNNGLVDVWVSPMSLFEKRLLIFGDSFGRGISKLLTFFFRDVLFARSPFFHVDIVDQMRPDYIVSENVERYLSNVIPDRERPSFHMLPYLSGLAGQTTPDAEFAQAFSAMLSYGRKPYDRFRDRIKAATQ